MQLPGDEVTNAESEEVPEPDGRATVCTTAAVVAHWAARVCPVTDES